MKSGLLSTLVLVLCAASAHAAEYWVGAGSSCDFTTIEHALSAARATPEADKIRIARNGTYVNQALLVDTSVELIGGYPTCGATDRLGYTALAGNLREAVLVIASDAADGIEVHLDRLDISQGGWAIDTAHWGGISIDGTARVHLYDSVVRNNRLNNVPEGTVDRFGGGITVRGPNAELAIERWVDIRSNITSGNGGGILVDGGRLTIRPHLVTIKQNRAAGGLSKGGGIAIVNGGVMVEETDPAGLPLPVQPVLVVANSGGYGGGGIYVNGTGSMLRAGEIVISDNNTSAFGSGLLVEDQGDVHLGISDDASLRHCLPEQECLRLSGNQCFSGGALAVRTGGRASLEGVAVRRNTLSYAQRRRGSAFVIHGNASNLEIIGSVVVDNACSATDPECAVIAIWGGRLRFEYTTFARNADEGGALIYSDTQGDDVPTIEGYSSLIADKERLYSLQGIPPSEELHCLLQNRGQTGDIQPITFQDPANGNYRLAPGNAAIDYCHDIAPSSREPDLNRQPRGIDDPNHPNRFGRDTHTYDLGAYEFGNVPDRLFADGFEAR